MVVQNVNSAVFTTNSDKA